MKVFILHLDFVSYCVPQCILHFNNNHNVILISDTSVGKYFILILFIIKPVQSVCIGCFNNHRHRGIYL